MNNFNVGERAVQLMICVALILGTATNVQAQDDSENDTSLLSISEFTIKLGHNMAFQEGVKAWKSCYLDNDGEWTWNMWNRMNGEGTVYYLTSNSASWAEFAEDDSAGQACNRQAAELIMPAVEKVENYFSWSKPEWSRTPDGSEFTVVEAAYFRISDYRIFTDLVTEAMEIIEDATGVRRTVWYESIGGGPDGFQFMNVFPHEDMASLDDPFESAWTIIAEEAGEDKRDELWADYKNSVENSWMYMFRLNEEMSHSPNEDEE